MALIAVLSVLSFATVLCIVEVPKLVQEKSFRELYAFLLLLALGVVLALLKSFQVDIGNPSDFFMWIYSPLQGVMESLLSKG